MKKKKVTVNVKADIDARPIAMLVQVASQFDSSVYIDCDEKHVNAKSIMGMMTLALKDGEEVTIVTDGSDEAKAADEIENYLTHDLVTA